MVREIFAKLLVKKLIELEGLLPFLKDAATRMAGLLVDWLLQALETAATGGTPPFGYVEVYRNPEERTISVTYSTDTEAFSASREKFEELIQSLKETEPGLGKLWDAILEHFNNFDLEVILAYKGSAQPPGVKGGSYHSPGYISYREVWNRKSLEFPEGVADSEILVEVLEGLKVRRSALQEALYHECVHFLEDALDLTEGERLIPPRTQPLAYFKDEGEILAHYHTLLHEVRGMEKLHTNLMEAIKAGRWDKKTKDLLRNMFHILVWYIKYRLPRDPWTGKHLTWGEIVDMAYHWVKVLWGDEAQRELHRTYLNTRRKETQTL